MNEVSADEWSETKVVGKANVGENQKWSEKNKRGRPKGVSLIRFMFFALSNR